MTDEPINTEPTDESEAPAAVEPSADGETARRSGWLLPTFGIACILIAIVWSVSGWFGPAPVAPENMDALDPKVRELVEEGITYVSRRRGSLDARMKLGMVYQANGLFEPAIATLRQVIDINPDYGRAWFHLGCCLERTGELEGAIQAVERAAELDPDRAETHARLGGWQIDAGELEAAQRHITRALELAPESMAARYARARLLIRQQRGNEAVDYIQQQGLVEGELRPYGYRLLADAHRAAGDLAEAEIATQQADYERPQFSDPWLEDLGGLRTGYANMRRAAAQRLQNGEHLRAQSLLEQLVAHDPTDVRSRNMLAICLIETDRLDQAIEQLNRVLEVAPENYQAHLNIGRAQLRRQPAPNALQIQSAFDHLQRCIALEPENAAAYQVKGSVLVRLNRVDEAIQTLKQAFERDARNITPLLQAGAIELSTNHAEDARDTFERAHRAHERDPRPLVGLANAWIVLGELDEAERTIQAVAALPDTPIDQVRALRQRVEQRRAGVVPTPDAGLEVSGE